MPGDRGHAGDPAAGAHDHLAVDRLADQAVRAADVVGALRRDRRRLDPEARRVAPSPRRPRCRPRSSVRRRFSSERSKRSSSISSPITSGSSTRRAWSSSSCPVWSPSSTTMRSPAIECEATGMDLEPCTWCGTEVEPGDGFASTAATSTRPDSGERRAVFCRLEHVVPWSIQGAHWDAGTLTEPPSLDEGVTRCSHCERRAHRRPRPARPAPRRAPRRGRLLLGGSHERVGEGRRALAVKPDFAGVRDRPERPIAAKRGIARFTAS